MESLTPQSALHMTAVELGQDKNALIMQANICIDMLVWVACEAKVYMQL